FDDLLFLAVKDGIRLPTFDNVLVDEAQDTNAIQRAILRKIMHDDSRLVAVGDPSQGIYGFRGADHDAMDLIKSEFDADELPLTVSYRCATAIVKYASQFGVIELAYELMTARKPAYMMGREIGEGLVNLIRKQQAKGILNLIAKLDESTS